LTGGISAREKVSALLVGAILILLMIPAMALYGSNAAHTAPVDYKLWVVLYFVYAIVVILA